MAISVRCECGRHFRARDEHAGRRTNCPGCGRSLAVEGPRLPNFDVFLSYSSKDKLVADGVCAGLEGHGLRCWIAPRDIRPGADWGSAIVDAIGDSAALVLLYTGNSNHSRQVLREVERAVNKDVAVIPLRLEDVPPSKGLEYFISTSHWMDAMSVPLEAQVAKLAESIRPLLDRRSDAPAGGGARDVSRPAPGPTEPAAAPARARWRLPLVVGSVAAVCVVAALLAAALRPASGGGTSPQAAAATGPATQPLGVTDTANIRAVGGTAPDAQPAPPIPAEPEREVETGPWQVEVAGASLQGDFLASPTNALGIGPGKGSKVAVVRIRLATKSPDTAGERARALGGKLSAELTDFLAGRGAFAKFAEQVGGPSTTDLLQTPARLFLSSDVELELPDGSRQRPAMTSAPAGVLEFVPRGQEDKILGFASDKAVGGVDVPVVRYVVSGSGVTAALVRVGGNAQISLAYLVPANTTSAKLRPTGHPPLDVHFE